MARKTRLPRRRLTTVEAVRRHFRLERTNQDDVVALDLDVAGGDAESVFSLLVHARDDGRGDKYGHNPLARKGFFDDAAIDCESLEILLQLPERSVRDYYLLEYKRARKEAFAGALKFYVDPEAGSDENNGQSDKQALRTLAEVRLRCGMTKADVRAVGAAAEDAVASLY